MNNCFEAENLIIKDKAKEKDESNLRHQQEYICTSSRVTITQDIVDNINEILENHNHKMALYL